MKPQKFPREFKIAVPFIIIAMITGFLTLYVGFLIAFPSAYSLLDSAERPQRSRPREQTTP